MAELGVILRAEHFDHILGAVGARAGPQPLVQLLACLCSSPVGVQAFHVRDNLAQQCCIIIVVCSLRVPGNQWMQRTSLWT